MERKLHPINWNTICVNKDSGGLGIRDLTLMNRVLLGKWSWKFAVEGDTVWRKLISLKYGMEEEDWFLKTPRGNYGTGLWKAITKEAAQMKQYCSFDLGDGPRVRFWEDTCVGSSSK